MDDPAYIFFDRLIELGKAKGLRIELRNCGFNVFQLCLRMSLDRFSHTHVTLVDVLRAASDPESLNRVAEYVIARLLKRLPPEPAAGPLPYWEDL